MIFDLIYWLVIGIGALLSFGASLMVKSRYAEPGKYQRRAAWLARRLPK